MNTTLNVALVQTDLVWENPLANRLNISNHLKNLPQSVDLIVLPEMFTTGFSMEPARLFESMDGESVCWMQNLAKEKATAIVGSIIIKENNKYYNRFLFVEPTGAVTTYDKKHLFTLSGEHREYTSGRTPVIIEYKGWKICPFICYDLRFPVWSRNSQQYDLLLYVANWPRPRILAWSTLLKARAIENMAYCLGVNRVGVDENGHNYSGNTAAFDFLGNQLTKVCENKEDVLFASLEREPMLRTRKKLGFLNDQDSFLIQ